MAANMAAIFRGNPLLYGGIRIAAPSFAGLAMTGHNFATVPFREEINCDLISLKNLCLEVKCKLRYNTSTV